MGWVYSYRPPLLLFVQLLVLCSLSDTMLRSQSLHCIARNWAVFARHRRTRRYLRPGRNGGRREESLFNFIQI